MYVKNTYKSMVSTPFMCSKSTVYSGSYILYSMYNTFNYAHWDVDCSTSNIK